MKINNDLNKIIKIGYFADGIWGHNALKLFLNDNNIYIKFICIRYNSSDKFFFEQGKINNIDILMHQDVNSNEFIEIISAYDCDLFVSMSFNQIFKIKIINMTKYKLINCHAGKLPFYRGRNVLNWVLINDEKEFGITVHYVDEGIDTGDIIKQKTYEISDDDDYQTILSKAQIECPNILYESIKMIITNNINLITQSSIHPLGSYCGRRIEGDEIINWNQPSRDIFNFVRALVEPGPVATTYLKNSHLKISKVSLFDNPVNYIGIPGQVIGYTKKGFIVKTLDSSIAVEKYYSKEKIRIGDRLG